MIVAGVIAVQPAMAQETSNKETTQQKNNMLIGIHTSDEFEKAPYSDWYQKEYAEYTPDKASIEALKGTQLNQSRLTVFIGTWCGDSHREFPRFMKILHALDFPEDQLTIYALDRNKQSPDGDEKKFNILRVPTFIIHQDENETGRIIEYPQSGWLEKDLLEILNRTP